MERFNYPNLAAVYEEDAEILYLLDCERYGDRAEELERLEHKAAEAEDEMSRLQNE